MDTRVPCHPSSRQRNFAAAVQTTLNLNADGTPLNYRGTYRSPHSHEWSRMDGAEISRLIDTTTIAAILLDCPPVRLKDITYYNPKPKEKYDDVNNEITCRIRGTIGGDRINYPGIVTAATADATTGRTVRSLLH